MNPQIPNSQPAGNEAYRQIAERLNGQARVIQPFHAAPSQTGNFTVSTTYGFYPCNASGGNITATLPPAAGYKGMEFDIKKTDSSGNLVVLTPNGSETIDGYATISITTQNVCLTVKSDGANWHIV